MNTVCVFFVRSLDGLLSARPVVGIDMAVDGDDLLAGASFAYASRTAFQGKAGADRSCIPLIRTTASEERIAGPKVK
jgi:hypothetical protein